MSFNFNVDSLLDGAANMFNALWPVFAIVVGLGLGIKLVQLIRKEVTSAF
jgi:hypothetical protein